MWGITVVIIATAEVDLGVRYRTCSHVGWILRSVTLVCPKNPIPILLLNNFKNTNVGKVVGEKNHVELDQMAIKIILIVMEISEWE